MEYSLNLDTEWAKWVIFFKFGSLKLCAIFQTQFWVELMFHLCIFFLVSVDNLMLLDFIGGSILMSMCILSL